MHLLPPAIVYAACSDHHTIVLSGVAGMVGGALSMAVGRRLLLLLLLLCSALLLVAESIDKVPV